MKKSILAFALLTTIAFTSCKGKEKKADTKTTTTEQAEGKKAVEEVKTEVVEGTTEAPTFENEKVGEYIKSYEAYIKDFKAAAESKDMAKFQELGVKGQELAKKAQEFSATGLSAEDTKKLQEYMTKSAEKLQEYAKKMMQ